MVRYGGTVRWYGGSVQWYGGTIRYSGIGALLFESCTYHIRCCVRILKGDLALYIIVVCTSSLVVTSVTLSEIVNVICYRWLVGLQELGSPGKCLCGGCSVSESFIDGESFIRGWRRRR